VAHEDGNQNGDISMKTEKSTNRIAFGLGLGLLALFGGWLIWFVTPYGVGIYYDSLEYAMAARNFASGLGLVRVTCNSIEPMTRYPPLYSLFLSVFEFLGANSISGARILDVLCMAGTVVMTGLITLRVCKNGFFSLFAALIISISPVIIHYYSWAMSEPPYMLLMLACIYFLDNYLMEESRIYFVIVAVLASFALLTRFIGIALIASCILFVFFHLKRKFQISDRRFIKQLMLFCSITLLPLGLWLLRSMILSGSATNRAIGWYLSNPSRIIPLAYIAKWFVPWNGNLSWNWKAVVILFVLTILFFLLSAGSIKYIKNSSLPRIIVVNIVFYLGLVLALMAIADPLTPLDNRILLPVYILTIILSISGIGYLWSRSNMTFKIAAISLATYLFVVLIPQSISMVNGLRADGQFYASSDWRNSEVSEILLKMGPKTVYTNDMTAVYFGANRPSCIIPLSNNQGDLERFIAAIRDNPQAVIAIYNRTMSGFVAPDSFNEGLNEISLSDGLIYTH
jgi:hypothetical protein